MSTAPALRMTEAEYLEAERTATERHEFLQGRCWAMSGGTLPHMRLQRNLVSLLGAALRGRPCEVITADLRIKSELTGLYTYPDASVVCGPMRFLDARQDTLLNPTVIFEVLSDSTEAYDRGEKFDHYRRIPSITDYLLVSQHKVQIEHFRRQPDGGWSLHILGPGQHLEVAGARIAVDDVYLKVFQPPDSGEAG